MIALLVLVQSPLVIVGAVALAGFCLLLGTYQVGLLRSWPRRIVGVFVVCAVLAMIGVALWPKPRQPEIAILGYKVVLFKPHQAPFANVFFQNRGSAGTIVIYSYAGLALATASPVQVERDLEVNRRALVTVGGGLPFTLKPDEGRWLTIFGPELTAEQKKSLKSGRYDFYFSGTIVNGLDGKNYDFCDFVLGNRPDVVLQCPEEPTERDLSALRGLLAAFD